MRATKDLENLVEIGILAISKITDKFVKFKSSDKMPIAINYEDQFQNNRPYQSH